MSSLEEEQFKNGISQFIMTWMVTLKGRGVDVETATKTPLDWVRGFCDSIEEQQEKENKEQ
jgi:hypothetical protein